MKDYQMTRRTTKNLSVILHSIAKCLMKIDKSTEAMDYFLKSLEIDERLSGDPQNDRRYSVTLHNIGKCLTKMDKPTKAMDHFLKYLKIAERLSSDPRRTNVCQYFA